MRLNRRHAGVSRKQPAAHYTRSILVQPAVPRAALLALETGQTLFFISPVCHLSEHVAHVRFDLFGVFAGLQAPDGSIDVLGKGAGRHNFPHSFHDLGHVLWVVFIHMPHLLLQFRDGAEPPGIVEVGSGFASGRSSPWFLRASWRGKYAQLLDHLPIAAPGADRKAFGLHSLGEEVKYHSAVGTRKFVDRHYRIRSKVFLRISQCLRSLTFSIAARLISSSLLFLVALLDL